MAGEGGVRTKAVNDTMSFPLLQNTLRKATYLRDAGACDFQGAKRKLRRRGDGDGKEAGGRSVRGGASRGPRGAVVNQGVCPLALGAEFPADRHPVTVTRSVPALPSGPDVGKQWPERQIPPSSRFL